MSDQDHRVSGNDAAHFRALLEARRSEIAEDDALSQGESGTVELDQARQGRLSRMDALQQQAMAAETHRRRAAELKRIAAALKRIDDGEYGYCLTCGDAIASGRLQIDPAATQCVRCAERNTG